MLSWESLATLYRPIAVEVCVSKKRGSELAGRLRLSREGSMRDYNSPSCPRPTSPWLIASPFRDDTDSERTLFKSKIREEQSARRNENGLFV